MIYRCVELLIPSLLQRGKWTLRDAQVRTAIVVDEESIFVLIRGVLLIRHGFVVRSWLANSTSHAGEGLGLCEQSA